MSFLDEVRLDRQVEPPPSSSPGGGRALIPLIIAVLVTAAAAAVYILFGRSQEPAPVKAEQPVAPPADPGTTVETGDNIELPPLDESDPIVRELVGGLSAHPTVASWLATDKLLRNFAVVTVNIAEGKTPVRHLRAVAPGERFRARSSATGAYLDPQNYARYDRYADAVAALDPRGTARLYRTLRPRLVEAYAEQGIPEDKVDAVLERAIVHLLETPTVEGDVPLREKTISYAYADARLESLSPAQKQLLRMGPRNVKIIKSKLRAIASYLGFSIDPAAGNRQ